jgi:hypothetical protein
MPVRAPGPHDERGDAQVLLAHGRPLQREARHDRGDAHLVDLVTRPQPDEREEPLHEARHLVAGAMTDGRHPPVLEHLALVEEPDGGLRVADVDDQQHLDLQVERQVEPRGTGRQRPGGEHVGARGRELAHALERDAAGHLDHGPAGDAGDGGADLVEVHVVEEHHGTPASSASSSCASVSTSTSRPCTWPRPARTRSTAAATPPAAATWLSLIRAAS